MTTSKTEKVPKVAGEAGKSAIQVLDRMMNILDALATHEEASSLKSLAEETDLHPSTAHRILNDLVACRLVERSDGGTYYGYLLIHVNGVIAISLKPTAIMLKDGKYDPLIIYLRANIEKCQLGDESYAWNMTSKQ
jgi:predicted transcriptional regulator